MLLFRNFINIYNIYATKHIAYCQDYIKFETSEIQATYLPGINNKDI